MKEHEGEPILCQKCKHGQKGWCESAVLILSPGGVEGCATFKPQSNSKRIVKKDKIIFQDFIETDKNL